ncbi:outer membrane beta-barrel protein [uncultured Paludibaculum sp.]|uniref:outer membrane beta-barrel protein n=1 Tax=uncultured Paludibaculum sp. TaxID=1765020 RepID=UPI002AABCDF9|nr:outer membrane beta-barrel protein [uncultured Paludibaculum sp.]
MRGFPLIALFVTTLAAQPVSIGAKGGVRFGDYSLQSGVRQESQAYTVGPTVEVRLPWRHLSLEMDALYKHSGTSIVYRDFLGVLYSHRSRAAVWDLPVLAKYSLLSRPSRLNSFVNGGYALRLRHQRSFDFSSNTLPPPYGPYYSETTTSFGWEADHGFAVGGGVEMRLSRLKIAPEFRYTRWPTIDTYYDRFGGRSGLNPQQFEILVGLRF